MRYGLVFVLFPCYYFVDLVVVCSFVLDLILTEAINTKGTNSSKIVCLVLVLFTGPGLIW